MPETDLTMNPTSTLVLATLLASSIAVGVTFATRGSDAPPESPAITEMQRSIEELRTTNRTLLQKLEALANAPAPAQAPVTQRTEASISGEQLAAAVEAYLQKRGGAALGAIGTGAATAVPATAGFDLVTEFAGLVGSNYWDNRDAWKKAFAAGRMDEVVKKFEELAAASPKDTKTQMDLANAYMAYLQMDNSKYEYSMKADQVFDKVLALDDKHWEARFTKAVSYTFYPDFLGKKKDAIAHFDTLVKQQEQMPVEASQAQTYLYLGNLLEARDPAKAREMWAKGAARHPDNQELAKKLSGG